VVAAFRLRKTAIKDVSSAVMAAAAAAALAFPGKKFRVVLNGKPYIEIEDDHIAGVGAVGVWTKADSVTAFDDFAHGVR
jgi:hypothetical protein